jgi:hypothetical protein
VAHSEQQKTSPPCTKESASREQEMTEKNKGKHDAAKINHQKKC